MRELPSPSEVLKVFEHNPAKTFRLRDLVIELGLRSSQARDLKQLLRDLSRQRKILSLKKSHFALHRPARTPSSSPASSGVSRGRNVASGRLIGHRDGYGFVVPDAPLAESDQDIFIPPDGMSSAMHGDRVEVRVVRSARGRGPEDAGRLEGRILRVTERAQRTVVGEFRCGGRYNYVIPYDHRIPMEIIIPRGQEWPQEAQDDASRNRQFGGESEGQRARPAAPRTPQASGNPALWSAGPAAPHELDGMIVDVEITQYADSARLANPRGRITEILGRRDEFGVDVEIIIRKFHLPHRFPPEVLAEAEAAPQYIPEAERARRRDFRSLDIVTIDGETAKDFDDAVHVERLLDGDYLLQVHIADVAHYVRPGTALDREARLRGTSVYFPDRAVPMLPLELSNGICSLNPHVDRLTMSVLMELDPAGQVVAYEITPGIIRSAERMTYTAVYAALSGEADPAGRDYGAQVERFRRMEELARLLNRRRDARGSIDFDLPEPEIEFDEYGRMIGVTRSERNIAHRIIEEFMLAANETVARHLERAGVSTLYRIHEKPDPKKVLEFEEIAATFGYSLGIDLPAARRVRVRRRDERDRYPRFEEALLSGELEITSRHYQRLTQRIAGKPEERILSYLMLRSLKQARYSEENLGHFALASKTYTHFTSPIRRYPDLIVHRILKAVLDQEGGSVRSSPGGAAVHPQELLALGLETSEAERRAADAEREVMEWKKVSFMAGRLGDEFEALIIGLTKHGLFVELTDLFIEGFVPLSSFEDDRYVYREKLRAIVADASQRAYRLGGRVRVRLDRIDRAGNKLEFAVTF